jgi:dTDP-4-dehydrorhamnose 3,5-epimerase-like enzyme
MSSGERLRESVLGASAGCRRIDLPRTPDRRGTLSFVEAYRDVPFAFPRVYWIYEVPGGATRGGHAYRSLHEVMIALSGSFDVVVDDGGGGAASVQLNRSYSGLYVPPLTWRHLENFSTNAVCLILASAPYDEDNYVRDYAEFLQLVGGSD